MRVTISTILLCIGLSGCLSNRMTLVQNSNRSGHPIRSIALNPSGGIIADAIGMELLNRGYVVLDTQETSNLLIRMDSSEIEWMEPAQRQKLRDRNIDAVLIVRSSSNSFGTPESVSVRLVSTHDGRVIGGLAWDNAKFGARRSPANYMVKRGVVRAAREITPALIKSAGLNQQNGN